MSHPVITELRELMGKATPGPWHQYELAPWLVVDRNNITIAEVHCTNGGTGRPGAAGDSSALIVAAVNALPKLLDVVEAAKGLSMGQDWNNGTRLWTT